MISAPLEPVRWSRRRWIMTVTFILFGQIALISYYGEPPHEFARAARSKTSIYHAVDEWSAKQISELPLLDDPTLFALPSTNGFSGKAWLTFHLLDYQMLQWTEPPAWLALDRDQLGKTFSSLAITNEPANVELVAKPAGDLLRLQVTIPPLNVRTGSDLRIEGALQKRRLLDAVQLPSWPNEDLLPNTVVQLLVNGLGDTISTTLLASSTLKAADDFALKLASGARFEPSSTNVDPLAYSSGRFVFQWHITPTPETNAPPLRP